LIVYQQLKMGQGARHNNHPTMESFEDEDARSTLKRKRLSSDVVDVLTAFFTNVTETPSMNERADLALQTGVDQRSIQVWFQNRRAKLRRESGEPSLFSDCRGRGALPEVSSKNFKELCLPKYLDVPFEQQQSQEERMQSEAIRQFWREQSSVSSDNSLTASVQNSRAVSRVNKRAKFDLSESDLLQSLTTVDMPILTGSTIPFQQILNNSPKLFKDPKTKQVYAPQLDPISAGIEFLFKPAEKKLSLQPSSSSSKDPFPWFPEFEF
jgi:hypothetical protein